MSLARRSVDPALLAEARALHDEVSVLDLHADTPKLMDTVGWDLSVRHDPPLPRAAYVGHVDIPRMKEGGLAAQWFGMWTFPKPERGCAQSIHNQIDAVERACQLHPSLIRLTRTADEIEAARRDGQVSALLAIEGGHALEGDLDNVAAFARRGVRYLGLLHFSKNAIGRPARGLGQDVSLGLTPFGHEVVRELERCGVIIDLAHINRRGFFDALSLMQTVPIVSHTGVAGVHPHWRNIDDEQLRAVADRGGVVGIIFAPNFLGKDGIEGVVEHLEHVLDIGGEDLPALGSDYDGMIRPSRGLPDVAALPHLTAALLLRGHRPEVVKKLLGGNAMRVVAAVPPREV